MRCPGAIVAVGLGVATIVAAAAIGGHQGPARYGDAFEIVRAAEAAHRPRKFHSRSVKRVRLPARATERSAPAGEHTPAGDIVPSIQIEPFVPDTDAAAQLAYARAVAAWRAQDIEDGLIARASPWPSERAASQAVDARPPAPTLVGKNQGPSRDEIVALAAVGVLALGLAYHIVAGFDWRSIRGRT